MDGRDHIVPVAWAILDTEDKANVKWCMEQLLAAAEESIGDGFKEWLLEGKAHFMDRGQGWLVVKEVFPNDHPQCVASRAWPRIHGRGASCGLGHYMDGFGLTTTLLAPPLHINPITGRARCT